jgi:hypothetical protein
MSEEAPSGYITMTAAEIAEGAKRCLDDRAAKQKAWDEALPGLVLAWSKNLSWWSRFWHNGVPTDPCDPEAVRKWYFSFEWTHQRPDIPGLDERPYTPGFMLDWHRRMKFLAPDAKVFIDVEDASVLMSWIKKET